MQVYAGLKLWPDAVVARLAEAQLVADGTYPNAAAVFAECETAQVGDAAATDTPGAGAGALHYLTEPRNKIGEWSEEEDAAGLLTLAGLHHEKERRRRRAKRLKRQAREREREERRRQERAGKRGGSEEAEGSDLKRAEKPSAPPAREPGKPPSSLLAPHSSLPDTERDDSELPAGVTPQEAKELHLNGSPVGISFEVSGNNTTALGKSYSDQINIYRGAEETPSASERGGPEPDGILPDRDSGKRLCAEAKFVGKWSESLYNPDLRRVFPHGEVQGTIDQALKYDEHCAKWVEWYTNSLDFVRAYAPSV